MRCWICGRNPAEPECKLVMRVDAALIIVLVVLLLSIGLFA